jgi:hypothetical protein
LNSQADERRRFSKAVAYRLAVLLLEEGGRVELPKRNGSVWLFSRQLGLPMPKPSMVPTSGIEPPSSPYERDVLPLNYAGLMLEPLAGIAPASAVYKTAVLLLNESGMEPTVGIEPTFHPYQGCVLPLDDAGE